MDSESRTNPCQQNPKSSELRLITKFGRDFCPFA
jgi:hypothetical protein